MDANAIGAFGRFLMLTKLLSSPRFLATYSGTVTLTFVLTVGFVAAHGGFSLRPVSAAQAPAPQSQTFDQITVHRNYHRKEVEGRRVTVQASPSCGVQQGGRWIRYRSRDGLKGYSGDV